MKSSPDVIKSGQAESAVQSWQPARFYGPALRRGDLDQELRGLGLPPATVEEILEGTRAQAAEIIHQAQEQAAQITHLAQKDGYEKGLAAAEAEAASRLAAAASIIAETHAWREKLLAESEHAVLDLVKDIAQILFGSGLALEPEVLAGAFQRALLEAKTLGDLRLHLHPEDEALLSPLWARQQAATIGQRIELVPDQGIQRGGCLIEGQYGSVDARVETQLHLALEAVSGVLGSNSGGDG